MSETDAERNEREALNESGEDRPLVVLIPDAVEWVLGAWAQEIAEHNREHFDFAIFPLDEIERRPERFAALLADADVVHCLSQSAFGPVQRRIRELGADRLTVIASIHHIMKLADVEPCLAADRIAVMCHQVREEIEEHGVPESKVFLLRKGIDSERLRPGNQRAARRRLSLPETGFLLGFAAKAASDDGGRKGVDVFLEALARLAAVPGPPVSLALTGPGWEATLSASAPKGVAIHHFPFLPRESMQNFYRAIDVYVSTARVEGGPVPPFEAMSCATPVVSTPVGMVRDLVRDGVDALLTPVDDVDRTVAAIQSLRADRDRGAALGRAGRERVVEALGCRESARAAHTLYASATPRTRRRSVNRHELDRLNEELIASDAARWRARLPAGPQPGESALSVALRRGLNTLRAQLDRVRAALEAPSGEVAHIDLAALNVDADSRVLDLGCGTGQFSLPLLDRGLPVVSVDLDQGRLIEVRDACLKQDLKGSLLRSDGAALPVRDASFDAVVCREMIEHIESPGEVLEEIARVLDPAGHLCVTVPSAHTERYFQWVDSRWLDMAGHVNVFTREAMCELLESQGFRVVEIRGRNFFYSLFWFFHTLVKTTHDGTGRIQDHFGLANRIFRAWRMLGEGWLKRAVEAAGNRIAPKSYVYYCVKKSGE